jgi:PPOX class probable F420-dependent enzyme
MASNQPTEVVAWANTLLETERVGRLGLVDDEGAPRVLPVTFAVAEGRIWSAIDQKPKRTDEPARLRFLRRDPRAALTVDRYSDDWDELAWVQVLGTVEIVDAPEGAAGLAALRARSLLRVRCWP